MGHDEKLIRFLELVHGGAWRDPPPVWNEQLRRALSDGLVTVGWGGVLKLTDEGSRVQSILGQQ